MEQITHIDASQLTRGPLRVKILRVESPSLFWVRLRTHNDFDHQQEELGWKMELRRHQRIFWPEPNIGSLVAVEYEREWCRGMVVDLTYLRATIYLGDHGRLIKKKHGQVFQLPMEFKHLSWQAIPCGLHGAGPRNEETSWPQDTIELTQALLEGKEGEMTIKHAVDRHSVYVELTTERGYLPNFHNIRETLEKLGYTRAIAEPAKSHAIPAASKASISKLD